jgi:hypothetical protein
MGHLLYVSPMIVVLWICVLNLKFDFLASNKVSFLFTSIGLGILVVSFLLKSDLIDSLGRMAK